MTYLLGGMMPGGSGGGGPINWEDKAKTAERKLHDCQEENQRLKERVETLESNEEILVREANRLARERQSSSTTATLVDHDEHEEEGHWKPGNSWISKWLDRMFNIMKQHGRS